MYWWPFGQFHFVSKFTIGDCIKNLLAYICCNTISWVISVTDCFMLLFFQLRQDTGARILFPTAKDTEKDLITIIGKQEAVEAAREELLKKIQDLVCLFSLM